jgi:hypothetical protein
MIYVPTFEKSLVNHETSLVAYVNVMNDVEVTPIGGVTVIE